MNEACQPLQRGGTMPCLPVFPCVSSRELCTGNKARGPGWALPGGLTRARPR